MRARENLTRWQELVTTNKSVCMSQMRDLTERHLGGTA